MDPSTELNTRNTMIYTDSGSDFPAEQMTDNVRICPLTINFGPESFKDRVDITPADFYRRLSTAVAMPTTAQPSAAELADLYRDALAEREYVLALHMSERLSGTAEAARSAALEVGEDRVAVILTGQVACGLSLLILRVLQRLETGTTLGEVQRMVDDYRESASTLFSLESLEFLQRGGRIGRAQYMAGSLLKVRPILEVLDGEVSPVGKVRGAHKVMPALRAALEERSEPGVPLQVVIGHAERPEALDQLREMILEARPESRIAFSFELGPTVGTHGGPGTIGFSFVRDDGG
jgi:DegV family protein with EDD domain